MMTPSPVDLGGRSGASWPGFPDELFTVRDDPKAAQQAAGDYMLFAREARATLEVLTGTQVESWVGSEGDLFRSRRAEFEPMLATAARVFTQAFRTITGFIHQLSDLKARMARLRLHAEGVWVRLQVAKEKAEAAATSAADAYTSFQSEAQIPGAPGIAEAESTYRNAEAIREHAASQLSEVQAEWDECVRQAQQIHEELHEAAQQTAAAIEGLTEPPTAPSPSAGTHAAGPMDILLAVAAIQGKSIVDAIETAVAAVDDAYTKGGAYLDENCNDLRSFLGTTSPWLDEVGRRMESAGLWTMAGGVGVGVVGVLGAPETVGWSALLEGPAGLIIAGGAAINTAGTVMRTAAEWGRRDIDGKGLLVKGTENIASGLAMGGATKALGKALQESAPIWAPPLKKGLRKLQEMMPGGFSGFGPQPHVGWLPGGAHPPVKGAPRPRLGGSHVDESRRSVETIPRLHRTPDNQIVDPDGLRQLSKEERDASKAVKSDTAKLKRKIDGTRYGTPSSAVDEKYETHHILPVKEGDEELARIRARLIKRGLDIDGEPNGISLPRNEDNRAPGDLRLTHDLTQGKNADAYAKDVTEALRRAQSKDQAEEILRAIREELLNPPQRPTYLKRTLGQP